MTFKKSASGNPGKPFPKGVSGNPGGRPKTAPLSRACREILNSPFPEDPEARSYAQVIAARLGQDAAAGDIRAAVELGARAEGRPAQSVSMELGRSQIERMSREEMLAFSVSGTYPAWWKFDDDEPGQPLLVAGEAEDEFPLPAQPRQKVPETYTPPPPRQQPEEADWSAERRRQIAAAIEAEQEGG